MQETRRSNRTTTRKEATLSITGTDAFLIITWDISRTGCSASIRANIPQGTRCTIQFSDDTTGLLFASTVVRSANNEIGVSFQDLTEKHITFLEKYL